MSYQNGHVDDGTKVHNKPCPNCGSSKFIETVSREYCPSCGLECDYWGSGANKVYDAMMQDMYSKQREHTEMSLGDD